MQFFDGKLTLVTTVGGQKRWYILYRSSGLLDAGDRRGQWLAFLSSVRTSVAG